MNCNLIIGIIIFAWNLFVFVLYAIDKGKAKKGKWRIPENTLLTCTFLFGGLGALFGMHFIRHKTKTKKFRILVPLFLILQTAFLIWFFGFFVL